MAAALGLGLAFTPAAAAPGAGAANAIKTTLPAGPVTQVGWRDCGLFNRRCRAAGDARFRLRAPGVGVYVDRDRRYHRRDRWEDDRRWWKPRWRRHRD